MTALVLSAVLTLHVAALGDARWPARDLAHRRLAAAGPLALPHLERGLDHTCPEVRRRCTLLLRPFAELRATRAADALLSAYPRPPWLTCGSSPWSGWVMTPAMAHHVRESGADGPTGAPDWPEYRRATRRWVAGQILAGESDAAILADLAVMAEAEAEWHRSRP